MAKFLSDDCDKSNQHEQIMKECKRITMILEADNIGRLAIFEMTHYIFHFYLFDNSTQQKTT